MTEKLLGIFFITALVCIGLMTGLTLDFIFFYPLFMSVIWIVGGTYFYYHWERHSPGPSTAPKLKEYPFASIVIPCHNEGSNITETIEAASRQHYPDFEIIAINDGSTDNTGEVLDKLVKEYPMLRVIHLAQNQGKAMALRMGALAARSEYIVCIDGDGLLHQNGLAYLVKPLVENPRVGAVTGNPRVRTRTTLIGKIQVGEFSSIVGLIKRAQRIYGHIFTVSGVIASFRRRALHDCGYWDTTMMTEDIDISWRLQLKHWQIQYEPCAVCWILMPETLGGLWKQRLRWAQGGAQVYFKNIIRMWKWRNRRMWMLTADFCLSACWAYSYLLSIILWTIGKFVPMPAGLNVPMIWPPAYWGLVLATVSLMQFMTALILEKRYDHALRRILWWTIWYPLFFWGLSFFTTLAGIPKAALSQTKARATWTSPDRGFR
jgi:biofilm PGA synthesis N-glycosyltransferase PgaC